MQIYKTKKLTYSEQGEFCIICKNKGHTPASCLMRSDPIRENLVAKLRCISCLEKGHLNCKIPLSAGSDYCSNCGMKGHINSECPPLKQSERGRDLFKIHVKRALTHSDEIDRNLTPKQKKYWKKVENKAFKAFIKKARKRKKFKKK